MKFSLRGIFSILLLASGLVILDASADNRSCPTENSFCPDEAQCNDNCTGDVFGKTHFSLRPQDLNGARKLVGVKDKIHLYGKEEFYGVASVGLMYQQTFSRDNHSLGKWFSFNSASNSNGTSCMTYGNACDGTFDIYGANFGTTASGTVCFDPVIRNFIADFDFWMGWDEFICGLWTRLDIPVNYTKWDLRLCDSSTAGTTTFTAGFNNPTTSGTCDALVDLKAGWAGSSFCSAPALKCGKICGAQKDTQVAAIHFDLGYDFIKRERGHVAASLHFVAPTGTRPSDEFLFNAVSGPQRMWQIGATVDAGYQLWENCDGDQRLTAYLDAVVTHLFGAKQNRLFGLLVNGQSSPGSSWLLLKQFNAAGEVIGLERAANLLCCCSKIEAGVMADVTLMLQYDCGCFSTGLGWNFWMRSREKVKELIGCSLESGNYGIKGDSPYNTNTTQSKATIGKCGSTDATPMYLKNTQIDICPAIHPSAFSNKIFGYFGYNWKDCDWQPFVAVEGGVEFGQDNRAANQWEVMLKGGVAF